jgi:hypothetical protein
MLSLTVSHFKRTILQCQMVAPTIVKEIEGGVDPETACTVLKLCDASGSV